MQCLICGCSTWDACEDPRTPTGNCAWLCDHVCTACVIGWRVPFELLPLYEPPFVIMELPP